MIKDFGHTLVLSSRDPEGFINFRYESGDPSLYILPVKNTDVSSGMLYINGLDINNTYESSLGYALYLGDSGDPSVASFHVYSSELDDFSHNVTFNVYNDNTLSSLQESIDVSIWNRRFNVSNGINIYQTLNVQGEGDTSYMLLRTNPKLTGNIKLNIDASNLLYLDTFKVSNILSNKKYRKQKVSSNSVYSNDVRSVFSELPNGELYRVDEDNTLDISIPKTNVNHQYDLNYSYGARLFEDDLYPEDYSLLAPLWINNKLPDYFLIFRLSGNYNSETYDDESLNELANDYIKNGDLVASWGMKDNTPLGTYLRNYLSELLSVRSPLFLSLGEDPNTWYGVATDKGIMTGRSEIPYFFDLKENFTDRNAFLTQGFERLNLLCPNLLNIEYIFSDNDVSVYEMNRYFGLYVTENPLYNISYYADDPSSSVRIISLDGRDSSTFFGSSFFDASGNISETYENRILTIDDVLSVKRITALEDVNGDNSTNVYEWVNKPGENIFSIPVEDVSVGKFVTLGLNNTLNQGEHFRIIDETQNKIWEIYGIDSSLLGAGQSWTYSSKSENVGYPTVYRTAFSVDGSISTQIRAMQRAWNVFSGYEDTPFVTRIRREENLSLEITDSFKNNTFKFQRITANTLLDPLDPSSGFNTAAQFVDITLFGRLTPNSGDYEQVSYDASFGPIDFELYGDRLSLTTNFIDTSDLYVYSIDSSVADEFTDNVMYLSNDDWYRLIKDISVNTTTEHSYLWVTDPVNSGERIVVMTSHELVKTNDTWNAYNVYPLTISLMGINPVKDFDYTVYDESSLGYKSDYWYSRDGDASTYEIFLSSGSSTNIGIRDSFNIIGGSGTVTIGPDVSTYSGVTPTSPFGFNTFEASANILASSDTRITYAPLDGSKSYSSYDSSLSEEDILDYYLDPSTKTTLKYGLTVPTTVKWEGLGYDSRNNPLRLVLDASFFDDITDTPYRTNFIPYEDPSGYTHYDGELSYPIFKYLSSGTRNWKDYVYYDLNDVIDNNGTTQTIKDFMLTEKEIDIFSKLLYSNNDVDVTHLRSSITYYNQYKGSIDALLNGLSISLKVTSSARDTIDIGDWDRFRISFISTPSRNTTSNHTLEVIINENTETILLIWYQGNDVLNYNKRFSSVFNGKGLLDPSTHSQKNFKSYKFDDPFYSWTKTPFIVDIAGISTGSVNTYGLSQNYSEDLCSPYAQFNINVNKYSIFNAYASNDVDSGIFRYFSRQYNTFDFYNSYLFSTSSFFYNNNTVNWGYNYYNNDNHYDASTCTLETFKNIVDNNTIKYYIFRDSNTITNEDFVTEPLSITVNSPRNYNNLYTYNGWYRPQFKDILEFNSNEERELMETLELDFTLGNTSFKSYNNISQYWYNKVVEDVTISDVSTANAIGYRSFNPFNAQWDDDYYTIDSSSGSKTVPGYYSSLELPSYFGSKLPKFPDKLELNSWMTTDTNLNVLTDQYELEYNLSRNIVRMFKNSPTFINNWSGLSGTDEYIDDYVKNTVLFYYNISRPKIDVNMWYKPYDGSNRIAYSLDNSFVKSVGQNVNGTLSYLNGNYLYKIRVNKLPNRTFYFSFTLTKK
jgi:hypothetical protein